MAGSPLDEYLKGIDDQFAPVVVALDKAILSAESGFDIAIKYRMLMYTFGGKYRNWVCAISTSTKQVSLRFLYGVFFDDPQGLIRPGSSHLGSLDFTSVSEVDPQLIAGYVKEAVTKHDYFTENSAELLKKYQD